LTYPAHFHLILLEAEQAAVENIVHTPPVPAKPIVQKLDCLSFDGKHGGIGLSQGLFSGFWEIMSGLCRNPDRRKDA